MQKQNKQPASGFMVILAFVTVYIVWGSTYYFIQRALQGFPPFLLGAVRFIIAGLLLLGWGIFKGEKTFDIQVIQKAAIGGFLMLFIGNGIVIWVEQTLPSAIAAIMVSSAPLWFVLLDKRKWHSNLKNRSTVFGLIFGFAGVLLLFGERINHAFSSMDTNSEITGLVLLTIGVIAWAGGSLYTKYNPSGGSAIMNTAWQMLIAGIAFVPGIFFRNELEGFDWNSVPVEAWLSLLYLIFMGSIAAYSAYVWLLSIRPVTQVSTYAYVNPLVAVLLGVMLANERISFLQITGLAIILISVLLINYSSYQKKKQV
jgi:drug/metabolite transporter (DMT)-like permease